MSKLQIKMTAIIIMAILAIGIIYEIKLYKSIRLLDVASQNLLLEIEELDKQLKKYEKKHRKDTKDTDNE